MKIVIGNDHAGISLKYIVIKHLKSKGYEIINLGCNENEKIDYPIIGEKVANYVKNQKADIGIAICGTGVGISIACNKVKGIRAACVSEPYSAKLTKMHNNANILCFGARVVGEEVAKMIVDEWLDASFEGGRHLNRIKMIDEIEIKQ